jgi:transcriptional regulator with XRE-family HTH domain
MGRNSRSRPIRLAEKLKHIRESLNLSQDGMLTRLGLNETEGFERSVISAFELDKREPALDVLLSYARIANIYVEVLIDDKIDLPKMLPSKTKSEGIKRLD